MGNELIKNCEIQKDHYSEAGFQSFWKIHQATKIEDKSKSVFSTFIFKKRTLNGKHIPPALKEEILNILKKEPQTLAKFKHPYILNLTEPLIEHSKCLVFATEHIKSSLQNLLTTENFSEIYHSDMELKLHVLELLEGISFMHNTVKNAHFNICPENIYITEDNKWKLSGFNFTTLLPNESYKSYKENDQTFKDFPRLFCPNLNYSAPELLDNSNYFSDIFSLGMTILTILKGCERKDRSSVFKCSSMIKHKEEISIFIGQIESQDFFIKLNANLKSILTKMLRLDISSRPTIQEIQTCSWLNDPLVQTINYLESLYQKSGPQQAVFFKGFSKIILKFEFQIIKLRILPKILEFIHHDNCSSLVVQSVFLLMEQKDLISKDEFMSIIWPSLKSLTFKKEISAGSLLLLVKNTSKLIEYLSSNDFQTFLFPLLLKCFDCGVGKLEEGILKNTEFFIKKMEFSLIKNKILPRVLKLALDEKHESRKNAIFAINKMYSIFDKTTIMDQILPNLEKALKKSNDLEITLLILSMYEGMSKIIGLQVFFSC